MALQPSAGQKPLAGVDPRQVHTPAELAAALNALRGDRSYANLSKAVRPGRLASSTISDLLREGRPSVETLELFLKACGLPEEHKELWRTARERAVTADPPHLAEVVRVERADPRRLGVHAAIDAPGAIGELPVYVERDTDTDPRGVRALIAQAAQRGGMVVLVGGSSVGKTRCAFEALTALVPQWWLLHPADAEQVRQAAAAPLDRLVVWLDELQRYLGGPAGLSAATVRTLLHAGTVVVATVWPERHTAYTTPPAPGRDDPYTAERELLGLAHVVHLDTGLSAAEHQRALNAADEDPRIALALRSADYGLTQVIAAAPQLIDRWHSADPYAAAILNAAIDATRLGSHSPLSADLLRTAAPGYCDPRQRAAAPLNWFEAGLAYATQTLHGATAALAPIAAPGEMGTPVGYLVADYLQQHVGRQRRTIKVPVTVWKALIQYLTHPEDQIRVGLSAENRLLYCYAEPLYGNAAHAGGQDAYERLAELLTEPDRLKGLWDQADAGDGKAAERLATLLARQGRWEELRARADSGDEQATGRLADLLIGQGREEELRAWADTGNSLAAMRLVDLLIGQGRGEELRARADAGD
ncbi:hypothetical protein ACFV0L_17065, partial [Streptosporangium canum]